MRRSRRHPAPHRRRPADADRAPDQQRAGRARGARGRLADPPPPAAGGRASRSTPRPAAGTRVPARGIGAAASTPRRRATSRRAAWSTSPAVGYFHAAQRRRGRRQAAQRRRDRTMSTCSACATMSSARSTGRCGCSRSSPARRSSTASRSRAWSRRPRRHVQQDPDRQPRRDRAAHHARLRASWASRRSSPTARPTAIRAPCSWRTRRSASVPPNRGAATCRRRRCCRRRSCRGCDAIHPGYGFLSEDDTFAEMTRGARADVHRPAGRGARALCLEGGHAHAARPARSADHSRLARCCATMPTRWPRQSASAIRC